MQIAVRHRNVEVSDALRATVEEKVTRLTRFLDGMEAAEVRFHEEKNPRIAEREVCEVTMHGHGHIVRARATAMDATTAVDRVVAKLEHRMEKLKGKLVGRSHPRRRRMASLHSAPVAGPDGPDDEDGDAGERRIVKTKVFAIKPMTPEEALLQMELLGHDFFLFTNADTGTSSVVYHRRDGQVGLIEGT